MTPGAAVTMETRGPISPLPDNRDSRDTEQTMDFTPWSYFNSLSRVSCQKGPISHVQAWRVGPFGQDTIIMC